MICVVFIREDNTFIIFFNEAHFKVLAIYAVRAFLGRQLSGKVSLKPSIRVAMIQLNSTTKLYNC